MLASLLWISTLATAPDFTTTAASQMIITDSEGGLKASVGEMVGGIMSYVRWPTKTGSDQPQLCVVGPPRLTSDIVPGTHIAVKKVAVRSVVNGISCDALYLGTITGRDRQALMGWLRGRPILTLTDHDPSCLNGAMFCLTREAAGLRYTINLDAITRSGMQIDPRVLQMGRKQDGQP